jgi:membrane protease YdiL (CAAX protease family)
MATETNRSLLSRVLRGDDQKIRATYRVVLAFVAYILALLIARIAVVSVLDVSILTAVILNVLSATLMGLLFYFGWVRWLDSRPLRDYGISGSVSDIGYFALTFVATIVGIGLWFGIWSATGQLSIEAPLAFEEGSLFISVVLIAVWVTGGAIVQDLAFLGLIFTNSVDGVNSRINSRVVSLISGVAVTGVFFIAYHFLFGVGLVQYLPPLQAAAFLLIGLLFFLTVYLYTNSLPAAVGAHSASNYSGFLFSWDQLAADPSIPVPDVFVVTGATPLTEIVGPTRLTAFLISFALIAAVTRIPVFESDSTQILSDQL